MRYDEPPTDVVSVNLGSVMPMYSAIWSVLVVERSPSTSSLLTPASSKAFQAASMSNCIEDLLGTTPISSHSAAPMMATWRERFRKSRGMLASLPDREERLSLRPPAQTLLIRQNGRASGGIRATGAVNETDLRVGHLAFARLATKLPYRLDDGEDAIHARVGIREAPAVRVHREGAARRRPLPLHELPELSWPAEAQRLQRHAHRVGEGVVQLDEIEVLVLAPRHRERARPRDAGRRPGQVGHRVDSCMGMRLAETQDVDRLLLVVLCPLGGREEHGSARVGDQTAVEQVEGVRDPAGVVVVLEGHRIAHEGHRIELRPLARRHRDLRQIVIAGPILVHVAPRGERVLRWLSHNALPAGPQRGSLSTRPTTGTTDTRTTARPVGDEGHLAKPVGDGHRGVPYVDHERGAAHRCPIRVAGKDAEVLRLLQRPKAGGEHCVDLLFLHAGIFHGVPRSLSVQLDWALVRHDAHLVGLCHADDRYLSREITEVTRHVCRLHPRLGPRVPRYAS